MNDKYIRMHFQEHIGFRPMQTGAYEVVKKPKYPQLCGLLFKWLQKLKYLQPYLDREMVTRSVVLDREMAALKIIEMAADQMKHFGAGHWPSKVYLGREQFHQLVSNAPPWFFAPVSFEIEHEVPKLRYPADEYYTTAAPATSPRTR